MQTSRPPIHPIIALIFAIFAVSTASIFIRYAQQHASSLVIAAARLALATLVLTPVALARRRSELAGMSSRDWLLALISGLFLAAHFVTWITSLEYTSVASSVVLVSTVPLWVALLSPFTIKEPISRAILFGMLISLAGGVIVGLSDSCSWSAAGLTCPNMVDFLSGKAFLGDLLALAGAIAAAGYLLIGRSLRARVSLISYIFVVYGMGAIVLLLVLFLSGGSFLGYPPSTYFWLVLLALVPQLIGHSTYNWALGYLSAAYVSIALLGEPIGSAILAFLLLEETPTLFKIFGAILILTGIYIASRSEVKVDT